MAAHLIKTLAEYHRLNNLPKPQHPLISVLRFEDLNPVAGRYPKSVANNFYCIALKKNFDATMKYGQQEYDFDEGVLAFIAPHQILSVVGKENHKFKHTGWLLLFHPDFLWNTPLAKKIKNYDYFGYHLNEALHLSDKEETMLIGIMANINQEYHPGSVCQ